MTRVAVVTGGASGIGAALAAALAARGAKVIVADLDGDGAAAVAARIAGAEGVPLDVTSADAVEALAARAFADHGAVDLWINNAGIAIAGATADLALADWRRVLDVNLTGVIHGVHAVYPRMVRRGAGHLVNVASVGGLAPYPFALPYTTSKHAVVGLSLALRAEARGLGVKVSVACPGAVDTPIWRRSEVRGALARGRDRVLGRAPRTTPAQCADAIVRGISANRGVIVVTAEARAAWWLTRLSPALTGWISHRVAGLARRASGV
jgi:NAD(P)-dependent dehydrogenase (short-subunit alcohol dehydrogenase family)